MDTFLCHFFVLVSIVATSIGMILLSLWVMFLVEVFSCWIFMETFAIGF